MLRLRRVLTPKKPPPTPEPEVRNSAEPMLIPFSMVRPGGRFRTGVGPNASWMWKISEALGQPLNTDMRFVGDRQHVAPDALVVAWSEAELTESGRDAIRLLRTVGTLDESSVAGPPPRGGLAINWTHELPVLLTPPDTTCVVTEFGFVRLGHSFYDRNPDEREAIRYVKDGERHGVSRVRGHSDILRRFTQREIVCVTDLSSLESEGVQEFRNRTPRQRRPGAT